MTQPFHFGDPGRTLFGMRHPAATTPHAAMLVCAPLLQDGIRCHRSLWALAEALALAGTEVLRFDWFGSGDSGGDHVDIGLDGLLADLRVARAFLDTAPGGLPVRILAYRSAALPVLAHLAGPSVEPVDLVLWDPQLVGRATVSEWRRQHVMQVRETGRYPRGGVVAERNELLGFDVDPAFLDALAGVDATGIRLPAGSRVLVAAWEQGEDLRRFIATQRAAGVTVEEVSLDPADCPAWLEPKVFEHQAFPRRSVAGLARHLAAEAA